MGTYDTNDTSTCGNCYTVTVTDYMTSNTCCTGAYYYCPPPPKQIIVRLPGKWSKRVRLAWVKLINEDTETGWKVTILIEGIVTVIDPNIERRDVKDFIELMKWRASEKDKKTLDAFIRKHGA